MVQYFIKKFESDAMKPSLRFYNVNKKENTNLLGQMGVKE